MTAENPQAAPAFIAEIATQAITTPSVPERRPVDVSDVIELIESNNGNGNLRFEPAQYAKKLTHNYRTISAIVKANQCSVETAHIIYSSSWGAFQIMGFNLYDPDDCAVQVSVFDFVADMNRQRAAFYIFLHRCGIAFTIADLCDAAKRLHFASVYNGPANAETYSAKLLRAMVALNVA